MLTERYRIALFSAWHVALYSRQKKLPDLARVMKRFDKRQPIAPQTPAALLAKVRALNMAFGGKDMTRHG